RLRAARGHARVEREPVRAHVEEGDRVAAGVDGEELPPVVTEHDRALRAETRAGAEPAGREAPLRGERAVGGAVERQHRIAGGRVGERVDRAWSAVVGCTCERRKDERGGDREPERNESDSVHVRPPGGDRPESVPPDRELPTRDEPIRYAAPDFQFLNSASSAW